MFGLLRLIRGVCGLVFVGQIAHVLEVALFLANPEAATGVSMGVGMGVYFTTLLIKVVLLGVSGFLFFWLRDTINHLHTKKHGTPHLALAENKWAL